MSRSLYEPPFHPGELKRSTRARSFFRFLVIFCLGVAGTLAWQAHGGPARQMMAGLSPRLAWLAPPAASAGDEISRDLAGVRQGVDKLTADVTRLQASLQRTAASPPRASR